jgi:hypothetical protein
VVRARAVRRGAWFRGGTLTLAAASMAVAVAVSVSVTVPPATGAGASSWAASTAGDEVGEIGVEEDGANEEALG